MAIINRSGYLDIKDDFSGADIRVSIENCLIQKVDVSNENIIENLNYVKHDRWRI